MTQYLVRTLSVVLSTIALAGCGIHPLHNATNREIPHHETRKLSCSKTSVISQTKLLNSPLTISWILPSHLPQAALVSHPWPLYTQSPLNQFPASWHGQDSFNHWRVPPGWIPYLYKNEKTKIITDSPAGSAQTVPLTLYITLQGTVFLYPQTFSGTQWPGPHGDIADIPPTTIVAEFVPLKPAVLAGVIPVSDNEPSGVNGYVASVWEKVLHMSASQINRAVR
ncbi:hypothetical protein [Sulfobacillus thermosulfidooxidans]|uniref:hypothetical protein n=1 Tax=Sulfobacillus thermosulfidooxidans TaxID=28034 RepID=UPI00096BC1DB|nr:hypothetical protein [Sulfobacillus thermosulfidooxidans]OLZ12292.1 hypothetical protein BFX05_00895 [Sulfobacillus thermosulfidooxidans]OLZ12927.1 hypothetical protein BFX06_10160 [Sulfobacillus thermosulfidooxidans]OLZ21728.1 hypothetical protein BFX07_12995 [Sulfobacillus thermosulfidooxidans]